MPLELGVWRIDGDVKRMDISSLDLESRLETILDDDISIASPEWMIVGRQVQTAFGKYIDLLAMDRYGNLIVLELKKDKTYKDIVAQVLDYGSWIKDIRSDEIAQIFDKYLGKYHPERSDESIDDAFCKRFNMREMPDELNGSHELVIVASSLDMSTERIVTYLAEQYEVQINAIFFNVFKDGKNEYLSRAWLSDPSMREETPISNRGPKEPWNGEYYASYSNDRSWEDAVKYGFFSAGGGIWYSRTLELLEPGARIWVNVPSVGYVGVGEVIDPMTTGDKFNVRNDDGVDVPIAAVTGAYKGRTPDAVGVEEAEYYVRVKWIKTVSKGEAVKEKGFFGNQNSAAQPRAKKWQHTVERLKKRFGVS